MILHHYELSPFSEKIRLMYGYCDSQWLSVISPAMPPRQIVDPLAGGYRRIPVAQIGADIFCDTTIIAAEISTLSNKPELSIETCNQDIKIYAEHIDTAVFMAGIQTGSPLKILATVFRLFTPLQALKFIRDRAKVQKTSSVKPIGRSRSLKIIDDHYADMESRLSRNDYLFGATPSIADFSAYHILWFKHLTNKTSELDGLEMINAWFTRMSNFGHGKRLESCKSEVFEIARNSKPRDIHATMKQDKNIGNTVKVQPNDYAKDSVTGVLVGSDNFRWVVARKTESFGTLHVHFPKQGFELLTLTTA
jgi:glutathione S-transferase